MDALWVFSFCVSLAALIFNLMAIRELDRRRKETFRLRELNNEKFKNAADEIKKQTEVPHK